MSVYHLPSPPLSSVRASLPPTTSALQGLALLLKHGFHYVRERQSTPISNVSPQEDGSNNVRFEYPRTGDISNTDEPQQRLLVRFELLICGTTLIVP